MMSQWWYYNNTDKVGPFAQSDLQRLFSAGIIEPNTLIWRSDMTNPQRLVDVIRLEPSQSSVASSSHHAGVWKRLFARFIDVSLLGAIAFLITGIVINGLFSLLPDGFETTAITIFSILFAQFATIVVSLSLIEAITHKVVGNTPGKALLGLKLQNNVQKPLTFEHCFYRSLKLNLLCTTIPFVNIIGSIWQLIRIGKGKPASYDVRGENQVVSTPTGAIKKLVAGFLILFLVLLTLLLILTPNSLERLVSEMVANRHENSVSATTPSSRYDFSQNEPTNNYSPSQKHTLPFPDQQEQVITPPPPPKFYEYLVKDIYQGKRAQPVLISEFDRSFRTRLRYTQDLPVDFAGEYVMAIWGCGTYCLMGAAVNARTGKVIPLPGSICCWKGEGDPIIYRKNSSLIVLAGLIDEGGEHGAHFYTLTNDQFIHIESIPVSQ